METINDCLVHYRKLLNLLDEDFSEIKEGLQGDLLDAYRAIVRQEIAEINNEMSSLKRVGNE